MVVIGFLFKSTQEKEATSAGLLGNIKQLDIPGMILFIPAIVCLLLSLQWGSSEASWSSPRVIALFVVFGLFITTFTALQIWAGDDATLPLRILKQQSILGSSLFSLCSAAVLLVSHT